MEGEGATAFLTPDDVVEAKVQVKGSRLFAMMGAAPSPRALSKGWVFTQLMEWTMKDAAFKTALFRFVDLLPSLTTNEALFAHLREYLPPTATEGKPWVQDLLGLGKWAPGLTGGIIRTQLLAMARQFVAAENETEMATHFHANAARGMATTIDLLGEAVLTQGEANTFLLRNLNLLSAMTRELALHQKPSLSDFSVDGVRLPRLNLSLKISALAPLIDPADPERSIPELKERLRPILHHAAESHALIHFDMEHYRLKELTLRLFESIFEEEEFHQAPATGIVIQAYLRESEADLRRLVTWARRMGRRITIRLVKGAYWDSETIYAQQQGWPSPVWSEKAESDAQFEKLSLILLENIDIVEPAFATHNVRSVAHAMAQGDRLGIDPRTYEFQALYGMAGPLKSALIQSGYRVREYCPMGELLPGMAYLVRRLLENTSNEGFIRALDTTRNTQELLQNPVYLLSSSRPSAATSRREEESSRFRNSANTDFTQPRARAPTELALREARGLLKEKYPLIIGGKEVIPSDFLPSLNPSHPSVPLAMWGSGGRGEADAAVEAARRAQPAWEATPVEQRARCLERLSGLLEEKRPFFTALAILEAGKPREDADAEVSEAIDFCRFYASEMRRIGAPQLTQRVLGEESLLTHRARGVGVIIAPWNFPLAILCGMSVAALVAGNAVVIKPAEQTSVLAAEWFALLEKSGVPPGVANLIMGRGEIVGVHLVKHPGVDLIAFTGSRAVGLSIWEQAGKTAPGQETLKKVVCEMGGKNAMIIDTSADLDDAIPAALHSAFSYAGQKCSALSRLIVLNDVYDHFTPRFIAAAAVVPVGDPATPGTVIGPVIDAEACARIESTIQEASKSATLAFRGVAPFEGFFIPPAIFTDVTPNSFLAQEEVFGPVVAILRAKDISEAIQIANGTRYALTGGLFSRTPSSLERARRELRVGNLYLNRSITGAIVQRHPFGGFLMSGGGTKAGGESYLENFLFQQITTENQVRRGFSETPV